MTIHTNVPQQLPQKLHECCLFLFSCKIVVVGWLIDLSLMSHQQYGSDFFSRLLQDIHVSVANLSLCKLSKI